MKMTFRWFGSDDDSVSLNYVRQIPGVSGVVGALFHIPVGEVWPLDDIMRLKKEIESHGLSFEVVESVNVHEDIKLGLPSRDQYIANYQQTIRHLAQAGVKVICYNFMPVFDWTRSDLAYELPDGTTTMAYVKAKIDEIEPLELVNRMEQSSQGFSLPGWEPERLKTLKRLFEQYEQVSEEDLFSNLAYFLERIVPTAEENGIRMAIHPDDPPWPVFGLPRIVTSKANLERIVRAVDSPSNSLTICTGSLGSNPDNDLADIMRTFSAMDRVPFVHIRNIKRYDNGDIIESAHKMSEGSLDLYAVMKALYDTGFNGYMRPDHGRMIWGEQARPGYGLYDRALGIMYLYGIWDSLSRQ